MDKNKNIVLIGMPGAGKSYIGKKLARLISHFTFIDIDEEIEAELGMKITEIFKHHGEEYFRELETKAINQTSGMRNLIISTGGGAFQRQGNVEALRKNGIIFYLRASVEQLFSRIKNETNRPLFENAVSQEKLENLLKKREKEYLQADFVIDTDNKQAYTILNDILCGYENYDK